MKFTCVGGWWWSTSQCALRAWARPQGHTNNPVHSVTRVPSGVWQVYQLVRSSLQAPPWQWLSHAGPLSLTVLGFLCLTVWKVGHTVVYQCFVLC